MEHFCSRTIGQNSVYIEAHSEILNIQANIPESMNSNSTWYGVHLETKSDKSM